MKIFRFTLTIFHFFVIVLLLGTLLNAYIPPKIFPWVNLLSLSFPVLMIINILMIVFWIFLRKKRAILFLMFSLIMINPARRWVNFSKKSTEIPNLKIVTANLKMNIAGSKTTSKYLKNTEADVILIQENGFLFDIPEYKKNSEGYQIVALQTKHEIVNQGKLVESIEGNSFFADVKIRNKTIRFINVYLNPFSFVKQKVRPTEDLSQNKLKISYILKRLIPTFKIHQEEIASIRKAIDHSPYPVILTGDLNAVPNSYEYYHLGENLRDAFVEVGNGSSTSFHDYKFPIRLDYVFSSKEIKSVSYKVDRSVKISDHFPVIAEFKID